MQQVIAELTALAQRIVEESGYPVGFDARAWLDEWLLKSVRALGKRRPIVVLRDASGLDVVCTILVGVQSRAHW